MEINQIKEILKNKTSEELIAMEIDCNRKIRKPYAFGLEVAKFHRRLIRQIIKEQHARQFAGWTKVGA